MAEPLVRILREGAHDQRLEARVDVRTALRLARHHRVLGEVLAHELAKGSSAEHRLSAEQLVHDRAERIDIRAMIDGHPARLFRRHVRGRADHRSGCGLESHVFVVPVEQLRDAEVEQLDELGPVRGRHDDHVIRLEIAVHDTYGMCGAQAVADLHQDGERAGHVDSGPRPFPEALPAQQLHDDEGRAIFDLDEVRDVDDIAMANAIDGLRFLEEAQHRVAPASVIGAQQLERDLAAELHVLGAIDVAHAALAEELRQAIAAELRAEAELGIVGVTWGRRWLGLARRGRFITAGGRLDLRALVAVGLVGSDRERGRIQPFDLIDVDRERGCRLPATCRRVRYARARIASRHVYPTDPRGHHMGAGGTGNCTIGSPPRATKRFRAVVS